MKWNLLATGMMVFLLTSCEKDIEFKLNETEHKLVVEATIENEVPPRVIITKSVGYFSILSPEILTNSFVHNAEVYISNGTKTQKLKEYTTPVVAGINLYYYSIDSSNLTSSFVGELNHSYSLRIVAEGDEYTSTTTIPKLSKHIDSLWWKPAPNNDTTKAIVMVRATDPPGFGDYVRYFTKTNNGPFLPPLNSTFDDLFIDGTTYELQVAPGVDRNATNQETILFNRGDTITFKLSNIDKATYDFWRTMEYSYNSVGNPFSTPTKVLSNISNGALGYFGGYATQYRTLIIPK
jgi:hypothetical protein